jgi:outer membrane protein
MEPVPPHLPNAMNSLLFIVFLIGAQGVSERPAAVPPPPGPFDLQTCYELALLRSETIGMKEEDVRVAQARYWQAVGAVLPNVHFITEESVSNSGSRSLSSSSTSSGTFTGSSSGSRPDQFTSRINVRQPLFAGLRDSSLASSYKANVESQKQTKQRDLQLLYLDVADVFYQIYAYQHDLKTLTDIQKVLEDRAIELDRRVKLGKSRSGDLIAAQSERAEILVTIEQTRGLLGASKELLSFLIDVPASAIEVKDDHPLPPAEALEAYLQQTGERPDILAAIQSEISERKQLSAAKGEHWPTISAEGNYYLKQSPDNNREWNILLTCDLPLFEGGAIEARVNEHKALTRSSELNLEYLRRTADKDVKTAYNNFISAVAQQARIQEALKLAEENYRIQNQDYTKGIVSNLDVIDALRQMHELRRRSSDAESDVRINLIRLQIAAGELQQ